MTEQEALPLATRLWFAWLCLLRVLFDPAFAARAWHVRQATALPPAAPTPDGTPPPSPERGRDSKALAPKPAERAPGTGDGALQLLSLLQREGRLVDFLQQDIASFRDADVGAAARVVHEGCRKALRAHAEIAPVRAEDEGARVQLAAGFDANSVKLVGDVRGEPPYAGVLRHRGWRANRLELPQVVGAFDAHILAPAEVELG